MMRMSGIATETENLVSLAPEKIKIAATRKTAPGFRYFDKKAIEIGGGFTHRLDLSDGILIKDNHLRFINDLKKTISEIKLQSDVSIEVEAESVDEAIRFAESNADIVMLDNFSLVDIEKVIDLLKEKGLRNKVKIELSGNITPHTIKDYLSLDVDIISLGYLTHSVKSLDFSLKIE